jgi:hypothetical protein
MIRKPVYQNTKEYMFICINRAMLRSAKIALKEDLVNIKRKTYMP